MEEESVINLIFMVSFGMITLVLILLIIMYFSRERVYKEKMKHQQLIVDHKKDLLVHSFQAQEKERDRVAAELHDGIASKLNIIHVQLASIEKDISPLIMHRVIIIKDALQESIEDARRISHDLFPLVLEKFGLITALEELRELNRLNGILTKINTNLDDEHLDMETSSHLYRIVQELVNNAVKYSECDEIDISIKKENKKYLLTFSDNGKGVLNDLKSEGGMGLKSIRSRVTVLGGELRMIQKKPGIQFKILFK
ncbi:MAG: hypothetical protein JKY48_09710 [Flavobacteriales bacterium]|nr:hypothetical protein [Flavobacteriales bacterium]